MSSILDFLFGKKGKIEQLPTISPQQQELLNKMLSGTSGLIPGAFSSLGEMLSEGPSPWEQSAKRQFSEEIIPQIAERFSSIGEGAQRSSAFGQQLGQAGAGLAERLGAMRAGERQNSLNTLFSLLQSGLGQRTFGYREQAPQPGFAQNILSSLGGIGGGIFGNWLSGGR